jgi:hypothetical protein
MSHDDGINQLIDRVRAENTYLVKMGDVIEAITLDDKRYDRTARNDIPLRQAQEAIERYTPVKKKLVAWLQGNHELKLWKFGNLSQFMAEELEVPYGTYTAIIEVSDEYGLMYRLCVPWLRHPEQQGKGRGTATGQYDGGPQDETQGKKGGLYSHGNGTHA